jgi:hypothetical protein
MKKLSDITGWNENNVAKFFIIEMRNYQSDIAMDMVNKF